MPHDNVETISRAYEAWNRGDLDAVRDIYAHDVVADAGGLWPAAGVVYGPDAIIENFASIFATFEYSEIIADDYIERGDFVVVPTRWRGRLHESASLIEQRLVAVYRLRDGQVVRIGYFPELEPAMEMTLQEPAT
jgi:ketosteroid isomerase-like protein